MTQAMAAVSQASREVQWPWGRRNAPEADLDPSSQTVDLRHALAVDHGTRLLGIAIVNSGGAGGGAAQAVCASNPPSAGSLAFEGRAEALDDAGGSSMPRPVALPACWWNGGMCSASWIRRHSRSFGRELHRQSSLPPEAATDDDPRL